MKRKVGVLLTILASATLLLLVFSPKAKASENETYYAYQHYVNVDWAYEVDADGNAINVRISKYNSRPSEWNSNDYLYQNGLSIPAELNGHKVVSLGDGLQSIFGNYPDDGGHGPNVRQIRVPDTVKKINSYAFYGKYEKCFNIIYLPDTLEEIGSYAFAYSHMSEGINIISGGKEHTLPSGLKKIEPYAFYGTALKPVDIPDSVEEVGEYAFYGRKSVNSIGSGVKKIGDYAFWGSFSGEIVIPDNVIQIGVHSFGGEEVTSITIGSGLTEIPDYAFNGTSITELYIPENVVKIGKFAFNNNPKLEKITLSNGLKVIDENAFSLCSKLTEVIIPDTVTELGNNVFYYCRSLKNVELGGGITRIPDYAFYNCYNLESINIDDGIREIGISAFWQCEKLTGELTIPDSVTDIGNFAFYGCSGYNGNLIVGSGVTVLNKYVFVGCNFNRVILKGLITSIHRRAFESNVESIWIEQLKSDVTITDNGFEGKIYYKDEKCKIEIDVPETIKIKDVSNDEEMISGEYPFEGSVEFSVEFPNEFNKEGYSLVIESINGEEDSNNMVVSLDNYSGETYHITNLLCDKRIKIISVPTRSDLTLRTFIKELNNQEVSSREPNVQTVDGELKYLHTKEPVNVEEDDLITYVIRVYNEGGKATKVNEITTYLPEGLEFVQTDRTNVRNAWKVSEDGRKIVSDGLADTEISAYEGSGVPDYAELEMVVRVVLHTELEEIRLVNISEITSAAEKDENANFGSITNGVDNTYKYDEAITSTAESYIKGQEDDDDFENVSLASDLVVSYDLAVKDIDVDTKELLNGGEFELQDSERNVVATGVTENEGVLDFGIIRKVGSGVDTYYIVKKKSPEGYERVTKDEIKVEVTRTVIDKLTGEYTITIDTNIQETETMTKNYVYIPIYTKEQLQKIGSDEEVEIDGRSYVFSKDENYKLMNDIDLGEENWVPIPELNGNFNGNGFTIKNLKISIDGDRSISKIGLFGIVSGEIVNLNLDNVNITVENLIKDLNDEYNLKTTTDERKKEIKTEIKEILDNTNVGSIAGLVETGKIKNCIVSGEISADNNAVGGLVGKANGYILFGNDTNNINIMNNYSNTGGLIGYAKSSASIFSCVNNGVITTVQYNAGGLVGLAETGDYQQEDVKVSYLNNKIVIVVENRAINDNYSLELENKDIRTLDLLENGEFNVYNVEKHTKFENVKLVDGKLKLADIPISNLGTDTYYVEQLQAADSYIKTDKYVKFIVTRIWNGETEQYEVLVDYEILTKDRFDEETATDTAYRTSPSGVQYIGFEEDENGKQYVSTSPVLDVISIRNSNNNGNVRSRSTNAGGIIAKSVGDMEIHNSNNYAPVESGYYNASGIVAETLKDESDNENYVFIKKCINEGKITGSYDASGIIARSQVDEIDIRNSSNMENISANGYAAGAIGEMNGNAYVKNFENIADVSAPYASGVIANSFENDNLIKVDGVYIEGTIVAGSKGAGVIAYTNANDVVIENSKILNTVIKSNVYSGSESAFLVSMAYKNVEIKNNIIDNCKIDYIGAYSNALIGYVKESEIINVENVDISNSTFNGAIGSLDAYNSKNVNGTIKLEDINIENVHSNGNSIILKYVAAKDNIIAKNININSVQDDNASGDGTYGSVIGRTQNVKLVYLDNCNVNDVSVLSFSQYAFGGLIGHLNYGNDELRVVNSSVSNLTATGNASHVGGLVGYSDHASNYFNNNKIENIDINGGSAQDYGGVIGYSKGSIDVRKTNVNTAKITLNTGSNAGGLIGLIDEGTGYISDTICNDVQVNLKNYNTYGGIVGFVRKSVQIQNTNMTDMKVDSSDNSSFIGGLVAHPNNCIIRDTYLDNYDINSYRMYNVGSILAYTDGNADIKNSTILNSKITSDEGVDNIGCIAGGIHDNANLYNSKIDNFIIETKSVHVIGELVGLISDSSEINKTAISNVNVNVNGEADNAGNLVGFIRNNVEIHEVAIENVNMNVTSRISGCFGGLISVSGNGVVSDCTISNMKLTTPSVSNYGGLFGYSAGTDISRVNVYDSELNIDSVSYSCGGLVGQSNGDTRIRDINIKNLPNIGKDSSHMTGGLVGSACDTEIKNVKILNDKILEDGTELHMNLIAKTEYGDVGGLVGYVFGKAITQNIEIDKINITGINAGGLIGKVTGDYEADSTKILNLNIDSTEKAGGIAGMNGSKITVDDVNMKNLEFTNVAYNYSSYNGFVGGVTAVSVGNHDISNVRITDFKINDPSKVELTKGINSIGGVAGYCNSGNIENVQIDNIFEYNGVNMAGIAAIASGTIDNVIVNNLQQNVTKSTEEPRYGGIVANARADINNATVNSFLVDTIYSSSYYDLAIGGIAGITNSISNCEVNSFNINVPNGAKGIYGGIAGFVGSVNDVSVIDADINVKGDSSIGGVAAIVDVSTNSMQTKTVDTATVKNIKINNVSGYSELTGGIAGVGGVKNANVSNVEISIDKGKFIGGLTGTGNVCNAEVKDVQITEKQCIFAGGAVGVTDSVENVNVSNISINADKNTSIGGVAGNASAYNCTAKNISIIDNNGITFTSHNVGGVIGCGSISDCTADNIQMVLNDINGQDNVGGVVGVTTREISNNNLDKIKATNISIYEKGGSQSRIGGIAGVANNGTESAEVENIKIQKIQTDSSDTIIGGVFGIGSMTNAKVKNIRIDNSSLIGEIVSNGLYGGVTGTGYALNANVDDVVIEATEEHSMMGGVSGVAGGVDVISATVNNVRLDGNAYYAGGIAGCLNSSVENATVSNVDINSGFILSKIGGIAGTVGYVKDSNVNNVNITGYSSEIGGIAGHTGISAYNKETGRYDLTVGNIENSNVSNSNILVPEYNSLGGIRAGGIVGTSQSNINNCDVTDSSVVVKIPVSYVGGIVAEEGNASAEITECNVTGSTVENLHSYTGGIAGYANCRIADSNVRNTHISTTTETDLCDAVGGIVGHGSNEKKSATVIDNCEVTDSTVKGLTKVGGLAGAVVPFIMNSTVSDTDVTGYVHVGGVIGFGGDRFVEDPNAGKDDTDDTDNTANNVVNNTAVNSTNTTNSTEDTEPTITIEDISKLPIKITNCTVSNLNITGKLNVGEIIGLNSYGGIEFDGDDVITGTVPTGCTVTIIEDTTDSDDTQSEPSSEILEEQTNEVVIDESTATEDSNIDESEISNSVVNNTDSSSNVDNSTNSSDTVNGVDSSNTTNEVDNVVYNNVTSNEM